MARKISKEAVLAAIASPRTPRRLKLGLIKFARKKGWLKGKRKKK
jgi:hypothetical protein